MRISDWRSDVCSSDLRSYLPFLVCGALGLAVAALCRAAATAPVMLWAAAIVGGIGVGAYLAVNLALAMRTIPEGRAGAYLGVLNVAETLPGVAGPAVAASLLRVGYGDPAGPESNRL